MPSEGDVGADTDTASGAGDSSEASTEAEVPRKRTILMTGAPSSSPSPSEAISDDPLDTMKTSRYRAVGADAVPEQADSPSDAATPPGDDATLHAPTPISPPLRRERTPAAGHIVRETEGHFPRPGFELRHPPHPEGSAASAADGDANATADTGPHASDEHAEPGDAMDITAPHAPIDGPVASGAETTGDAANVPMDLKTPEAPTTSTTSGSGDAASTNTTPDAQDAQPSATLAREDTAASNAWGGRIVILLMIGVPIYLFLRSLEPPEATTPSATSADASPTMEPAAPSPAPSKATTIAASPTGTSAAPTIAAGDPGDAAGVAAETTGSPDPVEAGAMEPSAGASGTTGDVTETEDADDDAADDATTTAASTGETTGGEATAVEATAGEADVAGTTGGAADAATPSDAQAPSPASATEPGGDAAEPASSPTPEPTPLPAAPAPDGEDGEGGSGGIVAARALLKTDAAAAWSTAEAMLTGPQRNEALAVQTLAACAMDDGMLARTTFKTIRGTALRSEAYLTCRDTHNINVRLQIDGYHHTELVRMSQRSYDREDLNEAYDLARESFLQHRSDAAAELLGKLNCDLGRKGRAERMAINSRSTTRERIVAHCVAKGVELDLTPPEP